MKWNEVTWYSRLGAIILFVGLLPVLSFYIGVQYEKLQNISVVQPITIVTDIPNHEENDDDNEVIPKEEVTTIPPPVAESWGTIYGTVLLGPVCPVVQYPDDHDCDDRPFETKLALSTIDGVRMIKEFSSNAEGQYSIDVQAGTYTIRSAASANILPYCSSSESITVPINGSVQVDVFCDSGIR